MELYLISHLGVLKPVDDDGRQYLARKRGKTLKCEITEPRNIGHHRKFFAMVNIIVANSSYSKDEVVNLIKLGIGHVHICQTPNGIERWPMSIAFHAMDDDGFRDFYNRAANWVSSELVPMAREQLDAEVERELLSF